MNHKQEKPFIKKRCDKACCANSLLEIRNTSAHVEATWKCEVCESSYKTKGDLKRHTIRKHDPNEQMTGVYKMFWQFY